MNQVDGWLAGWLIGWMDGRNVCFELWEWLEVDGERSQGRDGSKVQWRN